MGILRTWFFAVIVVILFQQEAAAQKILLQENLNTNRRTRYRVYDEVKLKMRASKDKYTGVITKITDSTITINDRSVLMLADIAFLKPRHKHFWFELLIGTTTSAGVYYPIIDVTNRLINKDWPIPPSTGYIAGTFLAIGGITQYFIHRHYTLRGHKKLRVIDVSIVPLKEKE